jgi:hypothetical protein
MSDSFLTSEGVTKRVAVTMNTVRGWLRERKTDYCQEATEVDSVNIGRRLALVDDLKKESLLIKDDSTFVLREFEALEDEDWDGEN